MAVGEDFVVVVLGSARARHRRQSAIVANFEAKTGSSVVTVGAKSYEICSNWHLGDMRIRGTVNGKPFTAQVERGGLVGKNPAGHPRHRTTARRLTPLVLSPRAAELHALMPYKAPTFG